MLQRNAFSMRLLLTEAPAVLAVLWQAGEDVHRPFASRTVLCKHQ